MTHFGHNSYPAPPPTPGQPPAQVQSAPTVPFRHRMRPGAPAAVGQIAAPPPSYLQPPANPIGTPPDYVGRNPHPAQRSRRRKVVLLSVGATAVIGVVAAASIGVVTWQNSNEQKSHIRTVAARFAAAVDAGDETAVASLLCAEEAAALTAALGDKTAQTDAPTTDGNAVVAVENIQVKGSVASATLTAPTAIKGGRTAPKTTYLTNEGGAWKVCNTAKQRFTNA